MWEIKLKRRPKKVKAEPIGMSPVDANQYNAPMDRLGSAAKYMSHQFNAYCSDLGVQCTVMMDPQDFKQIFAFKNLGDHDIRIGYGSEVRFIVPGESTVVKVRDLVLGGQIPTIERMPHGNVKEELPVRPGVSRTFFEYGKFIP